MIFLHLLEEVEEYLCALFPPKEEEEDISRKSTTWQGAGRNGQREDRRRPLRGMHGSSEISRLFDHRSVFCGQSHLADRAAEPVGGCLKRSPHSQKMCLTIGVIYGCECVSRAVLFILASVKSCSPAIRTT